MQRVVDNAIAITKETVKTLSSEGLNSTARVINGVSELLLTILPGTVGILEGLHDWELRRTFRSPSLPWWLPNRVSSFNNLINDNSLDYDSSEEDNDCMYPASVSSQDSYFSCSSDSSSHATHVMEWITVIYSWLLLAVRVMVWKPSLYLSRLLRGQISRTPMSPEMDQKSSKSIREEDSAIEHHVYNRATDKRHGVIEDLHLTIEITTEAIFGFLHKAVNLLLSPSEACGIVLSKLLSPDCSLEGICLDDSEDEAVQIETLIENNPTPTQQPTSLYDSMNTDTRTCKDFITELGYPYEASRVVTSDGYILLLERIPRRDSRKVVYLQHGVMDSSMGWVCNGVKGSLAFAAYDQGYDVFLGNFRGLVSKGHVNGNISPREYWQYSINEHAVEDIPAMTDKIHEIKTSELKLNNSDASDRRIEEAPYKICAICHSLGGAAILMNVITQRLKNEPHRLSRIILLSPAGFHDDSSFAFTLIEYFCLYLGPMVSFIMPAFYIPTKFFRMLMNKLARDFHNYPAVGGLVQILLSCGLGGDTSNWLGVLALPHYNLNDMPTMSLGVAQHLAQLKRNRRFRMFDHRCSVTNMEVYGSPEPLDLGESYGVVDVPVDFVAGRKDMVIRASMVKRHYKLMKEAGIDVSYKEFECAHLDFTFSQHEELLEYVMSRLLLL